jgi:disulfide bond formation protein DsbB
MTRKYIDSIGLKSNFKPYALFLISFSLFGLGTAYFAQDFLRLVPCPLCLWERWPYRAVGGLSILFLFAPQKYCSGLLAMIGITLMAGMLIAGLHVGVELKLWLSPLPECNAILYFGSNLPATPAPPCDSPTYLIPHLPISMATMDFLYETMALSAVGWMWLKRRRNRSVLERKDKKIAV